MARVIVHVARVTVGVGGAWRTEARGTTGLAFVVAHPAKSGDGRAPALVIGTGNERLGWTTRLISRPLAMRTSGLCG